MPLGEEELGKADERTSFEVSEAPNFAQATEILRQAKVSDVHIQPRVDAQAYECSDSGSEPEEGNAEGSQKRRRKADTSEDAADDGYRKLKKPIRHPPCRPTSGTVECSNRYASASIFAASDDDGPLQTQEGTAHPASSVLRWINRSATSGGESKKWVTDIDAL